MSERLRDGPCAIAFLEHDDETEVDCNGNVKAALRAKRVETKGK